MVELISVHVAKTAGTSFRDILHQAYGGGLFPDYNEYTIPQTDVYSSPERWEEVKQMLRQGEDLPLVKAIHGHFNLEAYKDHYPEAKKIIWLRNPFKRMLSFYYWMRRLPRDTVADKMPLMEFARRHVDGYARINLADYNFVGIVEFFEEDVKQLSEQLDWPEIKMREYNKTQSEEYLNLKIADKTRDRLRAMFAKDFRVYNQAVALRKARITQNQSDSC